MSCLFQLFFLKTTSRSIILTQRVVISTVSRRSGELVFINLLYRPLKAIDDTPGELLTRLRETRDDHEEKIDRELDGVMPEPGVGDGDVRP